MLTRLEVQGFKNLLDVRVDFGPFTCIAGANGIGKSNVFDAIEFLSHLATDTLLEAAQKVRGLSDGRSGDPRDLFWDGYHDDHQRYIKLAAEMIVPAEIEDDLGSPARATTTFLRYELVLGYLPPEGEASVGRLALLSEQLVHINRGDAARHLRFAHSAQRFRKAVVLGQRRGGPYLSTNEHETGLVINVHGDGGSAGKPQPRSAARAGRSVLSTITTNDHPTILAARKEMQSWRRLALEPSALRAPDGFTDPRSLGADGRHLAATLFRIAQESGEGRSTPDPEAVYAHVAGRLADLGDVGVDSLYVLPDQTREVLTLFLHERSGMRLPARALSEGTLRFLALCVLLEDPTVSGLICMEEPENGIHPANLPAMLDLVRDLAVDPEQAPDENNPFRQVIVNTHSPGVVTLCDRSDVLVAVNRQQVAPDGNRAKALSLLPLSGTWRAEHVEMWATEADLVPYLVGPPGQQISLPLDMAG